MKKERKAKHKVVVRFTEEEYFQLKENIQKCRLFTQNYFRILISGRRPMERPGDDYWKLDNNLWKIRINLLQISSKAMMLGMDNANALGNVAGAFNDHCTKILNLMLRIESPYSKQKEDKR